MTESEGAETVMTAQEKQMLKAYGAEIRIKQKKKAKEADDATRNQMMLKKM